MAVLVADQFAEDVKNQAGLTAMAINAPQELSKVFEKVSPGLAEKEAKSGKNKRRATPCTAEMSGYDPPEGKKGIMSFVKKHGGGI